MEGSVPKWGPIFIRFFSTLYFTISNLGAGAFLMTKAAQKHFVAQKYGKILNLSSVSALGNRGQANYSAAKAGVIALTKSLGKELAGTGVLCNAIAPAAVETALLGQMTEEHVRIMYDLMALAYQANVTRVIPNRSVRTVAAAPDWVAWPEVYAGKPGVIMRGNQVGSMRRVM
jgi:NAD(P)-dependent dehydrogenase (short-subunit alcohol dehydrogenase family)